MKPTLYVHTGTPKTGTTTIQNVLADNCSQLLMQGVLYPIAGREGLKQHHRLFSALRVPPHPLFSHKKSFDEYLLDLQSEIESSSPNKVVISSEMFWDYMVHKHFDEHYPELFDLFSEVILVTYVRRPDNYCQSYNNTMIIVTEQAHYRAVYPDVYGHLKSLDRFQHIVRPFERGQLDEGDAVTDIANVVGINLEGFVLPKDRLNSSTYLDNLEMCRLLNSVKPLPSFIQKAKGRILTLPGKGKVSEMFSPEERLEIIERNKEQTEKIAREFLNREDGRLFYDPLPSQDQDYCEPKLSIEKVVQGLGSILALQQGEMEAQRASVEKMKQHVDLLLKSTTQRHLPFWMRLLSFYYTVLRLSKIGKIEDYSSHIEALTQDKRAINVTSKQCGAYFTVPDEVIAKEDAQYLLRVVINAPQDTTFQLSTYESLRQSSSENKFQALLAKGWNDCLLDIGKMAGKVRLRIYPGLEVGNYEISRFDLFELRDKV
ncbi:protein of unknown function [Pseudodesulfovibrio profundus]|uniref:Sulfotransferase domain-containing protein n=1 Tax=Pseudodesulfovibrio profundus TaxID=57320 RepID=A0A2C8FDV6_9BACT|nr:hypothetical protein [Pseudodesulfovibrio profundus]SOB60074.1 protein of unknown function [Pseudodesulfovibrio profundus]